jgi:hypothetical protein
MVLANKLLRDKEFTWQTVQAMHELRHQGSSKRQVLRGPGGNAYVQDLLDRHLLALKPGRRPKLTKVAGSSFDQEFDHLLATAYNDARQFLEAHQLLTPYLNYTLRQIEGLARVYANAVIITRDELSRKDIGTLHMGGSKQLESPALFRDMLRLLGLPELATADHISQTSVYHTGQSRANIIVLCENENYLKQAQKAKKLSIELQNAGGANISKLEKYFVPPPEVELYYACDWDYDGLRIFRAIAAGYRRQNRTIKLLTPLDAAERKPVDSPDHYSQWDARLWDDDTEPDAPAHVVFTAPQQVLIRQLMATNTWIEEESSEFTALMLANGVAST